MTGSVAGGDGRAVMLRDGAADGRISGRERQRAFHDRYSPKWAVVAGWWRARHRDPGVRLGVAAVVAAVSCGLFAFVLCTATGLSASLPPGLGGIGAFRVSAGFAPVAGAVLGGLSVLLGTPLARLGRRHRAPLDSAA